MYTSVVDRSPLRAFEVSTHGGLGASELGVVAGPAGVGKSQLLVHLALARALKNQQVLHISLRERAGAVHARYTEILDGICRVAQITGQERETALVQAERNRQILSFLDGEQGVAELRAALDFAAKFMECTPALLLIDGYTGQDPGTLAELRQLAADYGLGVWLSTSAPVELVDFDTVVELRPKQDVVELILAKVHGRQCAGESGFHLDPTSMLITAEDAWDPSTAPPSPQGAECTLYSGGAPGAEVCFGEMAARHGLKEINFTFEGHKQARTQSAKLLSARELAAGDVSLVYVSKRLSRSYSEGSMIRKVLQSLWHQVSRAQQVYVIGAIQADGTVTGGTGWAVELARMWHKKLWVFDQDKKSWFFWAGERWVEGVPVIETPHFCGTGTRSLTPAGEQAVALLFERSFGSAE